MWLGNHFQIVMDKYVLNREHCNRNDFLIFKCHIMKSKVMLTLMSLCCMMVFYSCFQDEDMRVAPEAAEMDEMQAMQIPPVQILPDLIISQFTSSMPVTQGPCPGGLLPNATCSAGGNNQFTFTAVVRNNSVAALPAGSFDICWRLFGFGTSIQTVNHNGIPAQGSLPVTSGTFSLPCPMGPPPIGLVERTFFAVVDCSGVVNEANENNNFSRRYKVCDDI